MTKNLEKRFRKLEKAGDTEIIITIDLQIIAKTLSLMF